ncbi:MAG TPA: polynucleotide adenylyltransferase PcnB [Thermodesulfobacteriaceae bacterium]|nr:polynucleotide adenylyltransferase PcnB [Thermodesulfobacteriaceae bacterium]
MLHNDPKINFRENDSRDTCRTDEILGRKGTLTAEQPYLFDNLVQAPQIVARPDHCISRKNIDREALKVLYRLKDKGYIAYLVGGSVRDLLLDRTPKDFDVGTNAKPEEIRKIFRNSRIIGKRFRLVHVYFKGGKIIEVSTFRRQSDCDDREAARKGLTDNSIFGTPQEDAFRRDLTINGLFYNIADFSVIDYVGGIRDLRDGIIRIIGEDPVRRSLRDPVRMMRAVRHAARTGFAIEKNTWEAMAAHSSKIRLCSVPRVRDEWLKDLQSGSSSTWADLMLQSGLFQAIYPAYARTLKGKRADSVKKMLVRLLNSLDRLIAAEKTVSEPFILALLFYPILHVTPEWNILRSRRLRWPTYEVRAMINDLIYPYDFSRSVRDITSRILAGLWVTETCLARNSWPQKVWNKSTFQDTITLFNFVRHALGQDSIGSEPHKKKWTRKRKKKR